MFLTNDAKKVIREFHDTMKRAKNQTDHLSVTMARLYNLHDEVENLFHKDDLEP